MGVIQAEITNLASFIGAMTVVGSALIWVWNKVIGQPREKRRERDEQKRHTKMLEMINSENKPLAESINDLNRLLQESQKDRENLNRVAIQNTQMIDEHEHRLDNHHERIVKLETIKSLNGRR